MNNQENSNEEVKTEQGAAQEEKEIDPIGEANQRAEDAEKKYADINDKYLRTLAEYDNFRKRSQKERESVYADAYMDAVKSILPIIDNVERITAFTSDEKLGEGIKLIMASLKETLEKIGVTEIECELFDPNKHNAVMHIEDESLGEGQIVEVFQKGYMYKDRVLRYAMVKVAN